MAAIFEDNASQAGDAREPAAPAGAGERITVQVYEIQSPDQAELVIELGVDHMGSVVLSGEGWKNEVLRETIRLRNSTPVKSTLIPLYGDPDMIYRTADYYAPDIMHFCDSLLAAGPAGDQKISRSVGRYLELQAGFRKRFPEIPIMRSIPVPPEGTSRRVPSLDIAAMFEPLSDYVLIDTVLLGEDKNESPAQPVFGFVGITGETCDWETAAVLVRETGLPVILAGGISPENVHDGVVRVRPAGVDSCTRTNAVDAAGKTIRFKKDPEKVKRLIAAVRDAEKALNSDQNDGDMRAGGIE